MGKTRDALHAFLTPGFLARKLEKIEAAAGKPVTEPAKTIEIVGKSCGFTKAETQNVLDFFIRGGQMTAGGVANAITAFSQTDLVRRRPRERARRPGPPRDGGRARLSSRGRGGPVGPLRPGSPRPARSGGRSI